VLACGDYLSPVEIPMISEGGSLELYAATLERLGGLLSEVQTVVPGHGRPLQRDEALRLLDEDAAYLEALRSGDSTVKLPPDRNSPTQRGIHAENVARSEATRGQS
jgi:glyoxylase-like metal-dependent hydrolase (beta-lactamase superfamily II)